MKKYLVFVLLANISLVISCGGGGDANEGISGDVIETSETCVDGSCTTVTLTEDGNFTLGQAKGPAASELPDMNVSSVDDTILTIACGSDDTTTDGAISFTCNLDEYEDVYAVCIHGVVYMQSELNGSTTSSGCSDINIYCDEYGFQSAEVCNTATLTRDAFLLNEGDVVDTENFDLIQEILNGTVSQVTE
jgi:hypothetical protein